MLVESGEFNSLSPNIQIQIRKTDFCTFTQWISWENLFEDQSVFHEVIALYILTTFSLDYVFISLGENWFSSLSRLKGLIKCSPFHLQCLTRIQKWIIQSFNFFSPSKTSSSSNIWTEHLKVSLYQTFAWCGT